MPTDEQRKRERFEAWVGEHIKQWEAPGTTPAEHEENVKHWLRRDDEGFTHPATRDWWAGWRARDAEVQALREALEEIAREDACVYEPSEYERGYSNALCDMGEIARAALAGGEEGEAE